MSDDLLGKGLSSRQGVVAEEPDDLWDMAEDRLRGLHFPVVDGGFVYAELLSHLGLEQTKVEPAFAEVVAAVVDRLGGAAWPLSVGGGNKATQGCPDGW